MRVIQKDRSRKLELQAQYTLRNSLVGRRGLKERKKIETTVFCHDVFCSSDPSSSQVYEQAIARSDQALTHTVESTPA